MSDLQIKELAAGELGRFGQLLEPERLARVDTAGCEKNRGRDPVTFEHRQGLMIVVLIPVIERHDDDRLGDTGVQTIHEFGQAYDFVVPRYEPHRSSNSVVDIAGKNRSLSLFTRW